MNTRCTNQAAYSYPVQVQGKGEMRFYSCVEHVDHSVFKLRKLTSRSTKQCTRAVKE